MLSCTKSLQYFVFRHAGSNDTASGVSRCGTLSWPTWHVAFADAPRREARLGTLDFVVYYAFVG